MKQFTRCGPAEKVPELLVEWYPVDAREELQRLPLLDWALDAEKEAEELADRAERLLTVRNRLLNRAGALRSLATDLKSLNARRQDAQAIPRRLVAELLAEVATPASLPPASLPPADQDDEEELDIVDPETGVPF